ncbi:MAG TPA: DUF1512 family protein [Methanobacterium sp.]|jgi:hypothetical protein|nr:MAG: DUF1512 domain-containing protein [Methanobacterium sp.]HOI70738.1 DUF1512 family protein [Methanobacterium sp.]
MVFGLSALEIIGILAVILLVLFVPVIVRRRIINSVNRSVSELENMVIKGQNILIKISSNKDKPLEDQEDAVKNFMEFFIIQPVGLDPGGIVRKLDKILEMSDENFKYMAEKLAPEADEEWKSNIIMTLKATLGINNVAKQVRHNLELFRKTGNLQLLLMLQMSLPLIMQIVKAQFEGVEAFSQGKPIGDGLGPLVLGMMMESEHPGELQEQGEMVIAKREYLGRKVIMARAKGPGARVGKVGKTINAIIDDEDINRIITVDAAAKLEGEETGIIAQGIGLVIGGPGVDRWEIEEKLVDQDLQLDAIIVKMSSEEAVSPLTRKIRDAAVKTIPVVENSILRSKEGSKVLLVGVGNSCGLPNTIQNPSSIKIKNENQEGKNGHIK